MSVRPKTSILGDTFDRQLRVYAPEITLFKEISLFLDFILKTIIDRQKLYIVKMTKNNDSHINENFQMILNRSDCSFFFLGFHRNYKYK